MFRKTIELKFFLTVINNNNTIILIIITSANLLVTFIAELT